MAPDDSTLRQAKKDVEQLLLLRDYDGVVEAVRELSKSQAQLPVSLQVRMRRLAAAALRTKGSREDLVSALKLLRTLHPVCDPKPESAAMLWLDVGRTLSAIAALVPSESELAASAFEKATHEARAGARTVSNYRIDQEHARLRARAEPHDKYVERMIVSAYRNVVDAYGEGDPYADGVLLCGLRLNVPEAAARFHELVVRARSFTEKTDTAFELLSPALADLEAKRFEAAEDKLRALAQVATDSRFVKERRAAWHLLTAVLSALGRFEEAEVARGHALPPEERLIRALGSLKKDS